MRNFGPPLLFFSALLAAAITLACGVGVPRALETVVVNPQTADALSYPNGQVPFVATGYYTKSPSPVSPDTATWNACYQGTFTNAVTFNSPGVAQCTAGASGTYFIFADVPNPAFKGVCPANIVAICGQSCGMVVGSAVLTCP